MAIDPLLTSSIRVGELPPNTFDLTDKIPHEKGTELFSGTIQQLIDLLRLNVNAFKYEIKHLKVDSQYIIDNFDETGLGKNLCLGWSRCNGNNGTDNLDGKVIVSNGEVYNVLGQFGGSVSEIMNVNQLPNHNHLNGIADDSRGLFVYGSTTSGMPGSATLSIQTEGFSRTYQGNTSSVGSNAPISKMQPYVVYLTIQKN